MVEKELRKMNRAELIEIIYVLKTREESLTERNHELEEQLKKREICLEKSGSIAEAALAVNHVFEAAQKAAEDYLLSIYSKAAVECAGAAVSELKTEKSFP